MGLLESAFTVLVWTVAVCLGLFAAFVVILFVASAVVGFVKGRPSG